MAIKPPSDIVLDVARAADPARFQMASAKLSEGAKPADPAGFDQAMQVASAEPLIAGGFDSYSARNTIKNAVQSAETDRSKLALQQFEAFVLQTFVESMLPKNAENTYGKGNTGAIWKSMLAEQIAGQVAKGGGIGIADQILSRKSETSSA
ncbi:rod-binding protein [Microvirga massiliensis]|jgi:hypothetical protein|uniref:rod-binding protein n=1 Tax=Microvirga massiliensis TaxID=1033741 RepID=UPI00062B6BA9|nr:rod-binding protein [Microvirga massiliensis]